MMLIPASMAFTLQSSCIIFTAFCSVTLLHRRLNHLHIKGISAIMLGVLIVSVAGLLYEDCGSSIGVMDMDTDRLLLAIVRARGIPGKSAMHLVAGVLLTLASQFAQALQYVSEEMILKQTDLHPVQVMGLEGLISVLFSVAAVFLAAIIPGGDASHVLESWRDTAAQLQSSQVLLLACFGHFLGVAGNSFFGLHVSGAFCFFYPLVALLSGCYEGFGA
jgi:drug/metabolite transporter (DMT)-like permease